jgi:hypothetical protein
MTSGHGGSVSGRLMYAQSVTVIAAIIVAIIMLTRIIDYQLQGPFNGGRPLSQ